MSKMFDINMKNNIHKLKALEAIQNEGRGVECVRALIFYLEKGDWQSADAVYFNERDKIRNYPEIMEWFKL